MITYEEMASADNPVPVSLEQRTKFFNDCISLTTELINRGALVTDEYETADLSDLVKQYGIDCFYICENFLAYCIAKYVQINIKSNKSNNLKINENGKSK